jgi:hypothetical protein
MRKREDYDFYIFMDYSENLLGYTIISQKKMLELIPKISKFSHFKSHKNKKVYLQHIRKTIRRESILSFFEKIKIDKVNKNVDLFIEILQFIKRHNNCVLFLCVDDYQFRKLRKLISLIDRENTDVRRESELKKGTPEYQTSLVIDNLLNIERLREK